MWTNPDCEDPETMAERYFDVVFPLMDITLDERQRSIGLGLLKTWMRAQREYGEETMVRMIKGELYTGKFSYSYGLKDFLK